MKRFLSLGISLSLLVLSSMAQASYFPATKTFTSDSTGDVVGIGTDDPGTIGGTPVPGNTFQVSGDASTTSNMILSGDSARIDIEDLNGTIGAKVSTLIQGNDKLRIAPSTDIGGVDATKGISIVNADGNVGIGTATPAYPLDVRKDQAGYTYVVSDNFNTAASGTGSGFAMTENGNIAWYMRSERDGTGKFNIGSGTTTDRLTIDNSGNVGIGVTDPDEQLELTGRIHLGQTTAPGTTTDKLYNVGGTLYWNGTDVTAGGSASASGISGAVQFSNGSALLSDATNFFWDDTNDRLGIGTASPKMDLHVAGDYYGKGHMYLYAFEGDGTSGTAYIQARDDSGSTDVELQLRTQNSGSLVNALRIDNNGQVGIGTQDPGGKLVVVGSGNTSATYGLNVTDSGGNSILFVRDDGNIGIGTTTSGNSLSVVKDERGGNAISASLVGESVTSNATNYDIVSNISMNSDYTIASGIADSGYRMGMNISMHSVDPGFLGTLASQYGMRIQYGHYTNSGAGTITNAYGIYLNFLESGASTVTNAYSLYSNSGNAVLYNQGDVGIGTYTPDGELDVTSAGSPHVYIQSSATSSQDAVLHIRGSRTTSTTNEISKISFETNDSDAAGDLMASISSMKDTASTNVSSLVFSTTGTDGGTPVERMRIDHEGNVTVTGITDSAMLYANGVLSAGSAAALQVNGFQRTGNIYLHTGGNTPDLTRSSDYITNDNGDLSWSKSGVGTGKIWTSVNDGSGSGLDADVLDGVSSGSFLRSDTDDTFSGALVSSARNKGVFGTYDSTKTDQIWSMGTAYTNNSTGADMGTLYGLAYAHTNVGTGTKQAYTGYGHQILFAAAGTRHASISLSYGHAWFDGDVTANAYYYDSDERLKENISTIQNPLEIVSGLRGVDFNWKEDGTKSVGFVAQEVQEVLPELVHEGDQEMLSVEYGNITAVLVEAVKEQQKQIEEQQEKYDAEIAELKAQVSALLKAREDEK